ncbi:hypothetical protein LWI28_019118 [Acer negundo]|uniref:Uncharacterized protein n=1 Tax=Acer negundo TaxID=4023 RepID=A0AAD5JKH4_ACENE|nr:hypothetical protein LWI28_019118 [Acer negundo]
MKSKERDKGNSNSTSSLDKGDCGQLKNEVIKALDGSGELLRSVEARTRDEEARSQEGAKEPSRRPPSQTSATGVITNPLSPTFDPPPPTEQGRNEEAKPKPKNPKTEEHQKKAAPEKQDESEIKQPHQALHRTSSPPPAPFLTRLSAN